jgi:hypothetical protein
MDGFRAIVSTCGGFHIRSRRGWRMDERLPGLRLLPKGLVLEAAAGAGMTGFRFRLVDTAGGEIGIVTYAVPNVTLGDTVHLPDGRGVTVLDVYDDDHGQEGGVRATLVVDDS